MELKQDVIVVLVILFCSVSGAILDSNTKHDGRDLFDILEGRIKDSKVITDEDIDAIANREYDSAHGRILAVNMAHQAKQEVLLPDCKTAGTVPCKRKIETGFGNRDAVENLGTPDNNVWEKIDEVNEGDGFHLYQGDIQLDEEIEEALGLPVRSRSRRNAHAPSTAADQEEKRNAVNRRKRLWQTRVIPYQIPGYMAKIRGNFMKAINEIQSKTCLKFVPWVPGRYKNYIQLINTNGCSSKVGRSYYQDGAQTLSLGLGCNHVGTIIHELVHAIGFFHEQARDDRDKYVEIKWENIIPGFQDQFDKYTFQTLDQLGKDYDYDSIMHYDRKAFTKNGQPTVVAIGNPNKKFGGTGAALSPKDVIEINTLYDCQTKFHGWTKWSDFLPCDKDGYKSRERYCYHSGDAKRQCGGNVNVYGIERDVRKCTEAEKRARDAIDGNWGRWSEWSSCSVTCDNGVQSRHRSCNAPAPSKYGKTCAGSNKQTAVCTVRRCKLEWYDTDFETGAGMWYNSGGQLSWRRHKGFTQTMDTGPMRDHTTGEGYYLYVESSENQGARPGYKAVIQSKQLVAKAAGQCLKFYYTMYGRTLGSLRVMLKQPGKAYHQIFVMQGDQGQGWKSAAVTIDVMGKYQLAIEGEVGQKVGYSDIAIDDVYIDDGVCGCQDKYVSCTTWALGGDCIKNKEWMSNNCPRTCKTCPCKDKVEHCATWSQNGQCESKTREYMIDKCPKGCGICRSCEDSTFKGSSEFQCQKWAKAGECQRNTKWMFHYCPVSCGICEGAPPQSASCVDKSEECLRWALKGECTMKNHVWMKANCPRSCNVCICGDNNPECAKWATQGECSRNARFMHQNCKRSCNKC